MVTVEQNAQEDKRPWGLFAKLYIWFFIVVSVLSLLIMLYNLNTTFYEDFRTYFPRTFPGYFAITAIGIFAHFMLLLQAFRLKKWAVYIFMGSQFMMTLLDGYVKQNSTIIIVGGIILVIFAIIFVRHWKYFD